MFVRESKYDELKYKYEEVVEKYDIVVKRYSNMKGIVTNLREEQNVDLKVEVHKIRELLDKYEFIHDSLYMVHDASNCLQIPVDLGNRLITTETIKSFQNIVTDGMENMNVIDKQRFYGEIKGLFRKYIKSERDLRDWQLCFKDITKIPELKLKKKGDDKK